MFHIEGFRYGTMRTVITPESPSSQAPAGPDPADRLRPDDRAGAFGTRHGAPRPVELGPVSYTHLTLPTKLEV